MKHRDDDGSWISLMRILALSSIQSIGIYFLIFILVALFVFALSGDLWVLGELARVFISQAVRSYWHYLLGGTICLLIAWACVLLAMAREAETNKHQAEEAEKAKKFSIQQGVDNAIENFSQHLTPCLVIDSNIWMNEAYDGFFLLLAASCAHHHYTLTLHGSQFDEIVNIKKRGRYGGTKSTRARTAIQRIEELQKMGFLAIDRLSREAASDAYADPALIDLLVSNARKGLECTFISDDRELRVRVRQHLKDVPNSNWHILEMASLSHLSELTTTALSRSMLCEYIQIASCRVRPDQH